MGPRPQNVVRAVNFKASPLTHTKFRLPTSMPPHRCTFGSTIDLKKPVLYRSGGLAIRHGGEMSSLNIQRRLYHFDPTINELTELKVGHFFAAHIVFPEELANAVRGFPTLETGPLRATYAFHTADGTYKKVKRRPCLLYAKDHRTLTVFICTSRAPDKYTHRFSPFNSALRLPGQPLAIPHSTDYPEIFGGGYIFFTHALVARLVEMKRPLRDFNGPGGIVIPHFDSATGDSWVPKENYRLSINQMKYIEQLNSKFWQGVRYDEHGRDTQNTTENGNSEVTQRRFIRRTVGFEERLLDKGFLPSMTGRQKLLALNSARNASRTSSRRKKLRIARWRLNGRAMLEVLRAHESDRWRNRETRGARGRRSGRVGSVGGQAVRGPRERKNRKMNREMLRKKAPGLWAELRGWEPAGRKLEGYSVKSKGFARSAPVKQEYAFAERDGLRATERSSPESRRGNAPMENTRRQLLREPIGGTNAEWSSGGSELTGWTGRAMRSKLSRRRVEILQREETRMDMVKNLAEGKSNQLVRWKPSIGRVKMETVKDQPKSSRRRADILPRERTKRDVAKNLAEGKSNQLVRWKPSIGRVKMETVEDQPKPSRRRADILPREQAKRDVAKDAVEGESNPLVRWKPPIARDSRYMW